LKILLVKTIFLKKNPIMTAPKSIENPDTIIGIFTVRPSRDPDVRGLSE
jgi:hypothetical protein